MTGLTANPSLNLPPTPEKRGMAVDSFKVPLAKRVGRKDFGKVLHGKI